MTDKKFTDEEIVRNYEWCIGCTSDRCRECTMDEQGFCEEELQDLVLDLINRQKETIETLRKCVEQHHIIRKDSKSPLSLLTEEIRAEAYKEFAEKLKKEALSDRGYDILQQGTIDNLLKEMVGEEE